MSHSVFYDPFYDFDRFLETFSPLINDGGAPQTRRAPDNNAVRRLRPRMDLHESAENNQVTATFELPGLNKEDVNIDLHNGCLAISADAKISEEYEEDGYAARERRSGKLSRSLQLPVGVKEEEITASMENGVLTVTFPMTARELAPKRISVA